MIKSVILACVALALALLLSSTSAYAAQKFKTKATLSGQTIMKGQAKVEEKKGALRLDVHVLRAGAFQTYDVAVNGEIVGQIFTNPGGSGRLRINRPLHSISVGDVVSVGPVSGVFGGGAAQPAVLDLVGNATSSSGVEYIVRYRETPRDGTLDRTFEVSISNGEPFQSVPVFVDGVFLAPLLPGDDGQAQLRMRTAAFIDDVNQWQPLPDGFPSLQDGSQVQVGATFVTLNKQ